MLTEIVEGSRESRRYAVCIKIARGGSPARWLSLSQKTMSTQDGGTERSIVEPGTGAYELSVPAAGLVVVRNVSYDNPEEEHTYAVNVSESGDVTACGCPHYRYREPAEGCKHMVRVREEPAVLLAATNTQEK
jgi:hypothetical protein